MTDGIDRRTTAYKELVLAMPKSDGSIRETVDGIEYHYLPEPRCRVCSSGDYRKSLKNGAVVKNLVDDLLLYPKSVADVFRVIEPLMEDWPPKTKITLKSLRTHQNLHLAWDRLAMRQMVERWAQEKGISILDAAGRMILTEEAWLELTAHMGWQRLLSGQLEPNWEQTQKAFERISEIKTMAEGEFSTAELLSQLDTIIQAVREEVSPEVWPRILARLENKGEPKPELVPGRDVEEDPLEEILRESERLEDN